MTNLIRPFSLQKKDKVTIISPSGYTDALYIDTAKEVLEDWDLQVVTAPFAYEQYGRFGGTHTQRLSDLQSVMNDKDTKMIFCSRGGYGTVQLLDYLDFTEIRKYPKWLVGYSDITALQLSFLKNGIVSLHAPMARHLTENTNDRSSLYLRDFLFTGSFKYEVSPHIFNRQGKVRGRLFGGNLAVMCGLIGTPYFHIPRKGILFIEDVAETPYKIDRMIWQLEMSGVLRKISGLIVGRFSDCEEDPLMQKTIYESIKDIVSKYNYPVVFDFSVGHIEDNFPLIQGGRIELEVKKDFVNLKTEN